MIIGLAWFGFLTTLTTSLPFSVVAAPRGAHTHSGIQAASPPALAKSISQHQQKDETLSTAELLLKEFRRNRPKGKVIAPASAQGKQQTPAKKLLLPEGHTLIERTGRLQRDAPWWVFAFDEPRPHVVEANIKLLPNAQLEVLVRTALGSTSPLKFVISGETTVYEGENYLMLRFVRRIRAGMDASSTPIGDSQEPAQQPSTTSRPPDGVQAASSPADGKVATITPADDSVDDVLSTLITQKPSQILLDEIELQGSFGGANLTADGTPIVRRVGRVVKEGTWWMFTFESDSPNHPEHPMKLLPNKNLELLAHAAIDDNIGLTFLVTGEVTLFDGENYLLSRSVIRRPADGNLTK